MENGEQEVQKLKNLTYREVQVFSERCQGKPIAEIAETLVIVESTVKFHLGNIYAKLELDHLSQAARNLEMAKFCEALSELIENHTTPIEPETEPETPQPSSLIPVLEDEIAIVRRESVAIQRWEQSSPPPIDASAIASDRRRAIRNLLLLLLFTVVLSGFAGAGIMAMINQPQNQIDSTVVSDNKSSLEQQFEETAVSISITPTTISPTTTVTSTHLEPDLSGTICGESKRVELPANFRFVRSQGLSAFTVENTEGAVSSNKVRTVAVDEHGVWAGFFVSANDAGSSINQFNRDGWANCNHSGGIEGKNINAIKFDQTGNIWVATENSGVARFDGERWHLYTTDDGLLSNQTFDLTIDEMNNVWVGTWEGVAKFDGDTWTVPYSVHNKTLFNNHVDAIAFDSVGNIWIGHIGDGDGVSQFNNAKGEWIYHTTSISGLGGDQIRDILVHEAGGKNAEAVWFATLDGGVSKYEQGRWTVYDAEDGLPDNAVNALAVDKYDRVWAATDRGVAYFDGLEWVTYNSLNTNSIAFGPSCQGCPFDDDHVWTGTADLGLTHSRIPFPNAIDAINVIEVCFEMIGKDRSCQSLSGIDATPVITVSYPHALVPGEELRPEILVTPRTSYQLREDRGDFLSNIDANDDNLFGAWPIVPVKGTIEPGQPFAFTDYDNPFVAPQLKDRDQERTFFSTWRVWMYTRYVGPSIRLGFTVKRSETSSLTK